MAEVGEIQQVADEEMIKRLQGFEQGLYEKLLAYMAQFTVNGRLQPTPAQLAALNNAIVNWTKELGYGDIVDYYLSQLDAVDEANRLYYAKDTPQRILNRIESEAIKSPLTQEWRRKVAENLKGAGAAQAIVNEVADTLRIDALRGLTFEEAAQNLKLKVMTSEQTAGIAERHYNQVAKDAIMQYDGVIQEKLYDTFKPTRGRYFGSIIETSRPICDHIKDKFGNGYITNDQLKAILNEYAPNGTPSEERITYSTVTGQERTAKKGSGMIEGTTFENFSVNRGGYNCRHEWKWDFSSAIRR